MWGDLLGNSGDVLNYRSDRRVEFERNWWHRHNVILRSVGKSNVGRSRVVEVPVDRVPKGRNLGTGVRESQLVLAQRS